MDEKTLSETKVARNVATVLQRWCMGVGIPADAVTVENTDVFLADPKACYRLSVTKDESRPAYPREVRTRNPF